MPKTFNPRMPNQERRHPRPAMKSKNVLQKKHNSPNLRRGGRTSCTEIFKPAKEAEKLDYDLEHNREVTSPRKGARKKSTRIREKGRSLNLSVRRGGGVFQVFPVKTSELKIAHRISQKGGFIEGGKTT